jgi:F0F1-type ATP synthase assembly protein I
LLCARRRDSATPAIDPEVKKMWRIAGFTGAVGIEVAAAIAIGYFGGHWLDRKFGTAPVITTIGFLAGIGAAIKALVRVTRDYKRKIDQLDQADSPYKNDRNDGNETPP